MTIRRQPFGYHICDGSVVINHTEADIVKHIFHAYICGSSYSEIKVSLSNQSVSYDGERLWNKKYDSENT